MTAVSTFTGLVLLLSASGILACISLGLGIARLLKADRAGTAPASWVSPAQSIRSVEVPGAVRLQRFDLTTARMAGDSESSRLRQETKISDLRFVLSDSAQNHLDIMVEYSGSAATKLLPVTVVTPERRTDYLLAFWAERSGRWVASINTPGVRDWADVFIRDLRELSSLTADDAVTVARSVRAVPDEGIAAWQAVELAHPEGDPVREAIRQALRPS
jgi:hypothetical protein